MCLNCDKYDFINYLKVPETEDKCGPCGRHLAPCETLTEHVVSVHLTIEDRCDICGENPQNFVEHFKDHINYCNTDVNLCQWWLLSICLCNLSFWLFIHFRFSVWVCYTLSEFSQIKFAYKNLVFVFKIITLSLTSSEISLTSETFLHRVDFVWNFSFFLVGKSYSRSFP